MQVDAPTDTLGPNQVLVGHVDRAYRKSPGMLAEIPHL
jgi:hypothetical protein